MPRRQYSGPRTPRKRKVWANVSSEYALTSTTPFVADSLLGPFLSDMGLTYAPGVTVMRVIGEIYAAQASSAATTAEHVRIGVGLIWVPQAIASASAGDSQIPEPYQDGVREDRWYHQFMMGFTEGTGTIADVPLDPVETSLHRIDTRNMQRQPTVNHQFCIIGNTLAGTMETNVSKLRWNLQIMLALP